MESFLRKSVSWRDVNPQYVKDILAGQLERLTGVDQVAIREILSLRGRELIQHFNPDYVNAALFYLQKFKGINNIYISLIENGQNIDDCCDSEDLATAQNSEKEKDIRDYLTETLGLLLQDIRDNQNKLLEASSCTEYSTEKESLVNQYTNKIGAIANIIEVLGRVGYSIDGYIKSENLLMLSNLRERFKLYQKDLAAVSKKLKLRD